MGLVKNKSGNWIYGEKIEVVLNTLYQGMPQKLQFKQLYIPFDNNIVKDSEDVIVSGGTVPVLCFEIQKIYVSPDGTENVRFTKIITFTDENKRDVKDEQGNILTEQYFENEITGYNDLVVPVLDEEGNPTFEEDGITPITTTVQEPIWTPIEKTRNIQEGELGYWIRTLGQYILPAAQKTIETLAPLYDN